MEADTIPEWKSRLVRIGIESREIFANILTPMYAFLLDQNRKQKQPRSLLRFGAVLVRGVVILRIQEINECLSFDKLPISNFKHF